MDFVSYRLCYVDFANYYKSTEFCSDHYPFFRPDDDRWKNSVRHNLSINPYFKKGEKARSGAGHLWTISEESRALRPSFMDMV
jgi:hypothetical protein